MTLIALLRADQAVVAEEREKQDDGALESGGVVADGTLVLNLTFKFPSLGTSNAQALISSF